jgi:hypothetical protein
VGLRDDKEARSDEDIDPTRAVVDQISPCQGLDDHDVDEMGQVEAVLRNEEALCLRLTFDIEVRC